MPDAAAVAAVVGGGYQVGKAAGQVRAGMQGLDAAIGTTRADYVAHQLIPPVAHAAYDAAAKINREGPGPLARGAVEQCQDAIGCSSIVEINLDRQLYFKLSEDETADFSAEHKSIASGSWQAKFGGYSSCPMLTMSFTYMGKAMKVYTDPYQWLTTDGHENKKEKKLVWDYQGPMKFRVAQNVEINFELTVYNIGFGAEGLLSGHGQKLGYAKKKAGGLQRVLQENGYLQLSLDGISDPPGKLKLYPLPAEGSHHIDRPSSICSAQSCWSLLSGSGSSSAGSPSHEQMEVVEAYSAFNSVQASAQPGLAKDLCNDFNSACTEPHRISDTYASTDSKEVRIKPVQQGYPSSAAQVVFSTGNEKYTKPKTYP